MLDYNRIICELIKKRKSKNKVIAACVYGSQINGTANEISDIDVLLITSGNEDFKGCRMIFGKKVEYFEKSFFTIMNEIEEYQKKNDPFYASFFRNCKVIFDTNQFIPYLKYQQIKVEEIVTKSSNETTIDYSDLVFYQSQFYNYYNIEPYFNHYYYVYLECLRRKYHEENNYSMIPTKKVMRLYQDSQQAENYCVKLPQAEYRKFLLHCILDSTCSRQEKEERVEEALQWLKIKSLDQIPPKEPSQLHIDQLQNYLISFSNESQKLMEIPKEKTLYAMHNLLEILGKLNQFYKEKTKKSLFSITEYEQLIRYENLNDLKSILDTCCAQFEINPRQYEIAYLSKKYRH